MKKNFMFAALAGTMLLAAGCQSPEGKTPDEKPIAVTGVRLDKTELVLEKGGTETLTFTVAPENATDKKVTWESDNEAAATVENGLVTAVANGEATITVTTEDGGKTDRCLVTVGDVAVESVLLDKLELSLSVGKSATLVATVRPANATNKEIRWSSSSANATVDSEGTVTAAAVGSATIVVTTLDGSKTATCAVTVREPSMFGTVSFASAATWTVGEQTWSDAVMAAGCKKDTYDGGTPGTYKVDCRQNAGYGDMFSWEAVDQYGEELCTDGWRVPTASDFLTLDVNLNGLEASADRNGDKTSVDNYTDPSKWNAKYGGYAFSTAILGQDDYAQYWSQSDAGGYALNFSITRSTYSIYPNYGSVKYYGLQLRCVK